MPNPYQTAAAAIAKLVRTRTSLPPDVSRTLGFQQVGGVPVIPARATPNPGSVTQQASAAGAVLELLFNTILFGSQKPPAMVATIDPLAGATFVPGNAVVPDRFTNVSTTIRGVTLALDDTLLVNAQTNQVQNGLYTVISVVGALATIERSVGCQNGDPVFAGCQVWDAENKVLYYLDCLNSEFLFIFGTDELQWEVLDVLNVAGTMTPARVATTADLGATYVPTDVQGFTGAPTSIDGVALADNDRVLVKNQATTTQNGVYTVLNAAAGTWERSADARGNVDGGTLIFVQEGTANGETLYAISEDGVLRFGTDAITYTPYPSSGGVAAQNAGVPVAGGPFTTLNMVSGLTAADGGGGVLDMTASGGSSSPCAENSVTGSGNTAGVAAADINDGVTAFDILNWFQDTITGDLTVTIPADPGGASAYKVGMRIIFRFFLGASARTLDFFVSGMYGMTFQSPVVIPGAPAAPEQWLFVIEYCGLDQWKFVGQGAGFQSV